jgi:hypothetical protein
MYAAAEAALLAICPFVHVVLFFRPLGHLPLISIGDIIQYWFCCSSTCWNHMHLLV